jgi:membrane protease YdiL (CAAX protease family)
LTGSSPTGDGTEDGEPEGLEPWSDAPAVSDAQLPSALSGPPGGRIFSLEGRPVPALYLGAWLFSIGGLAALLVATQAELSTSRSLMALAGIVALGLGLAAAAGYQLVSRADRHPDSYRGPSPLLMFGLVLVVSSLASALLGLAGLVDPDQPGGFLLGLIVVALVYLVCIELFVVRGGALSWAAMGWPVRRPGMFRVALRDIGVAVAVMIPVTLGVLLWGGLLATVLQVSAPETLPEAHGSTEALAVVLAAAVVAPIGEEAFFRGFALTAWLRDLGERPALIRSALFFALVHILNIRVAADQATEGLGQALLQFAVIMPLGLALGWLFLRRGIVAAIAGHMAYNGFLLALVALARSATTSA